MKRFHDYGYQLSTNSVILRFQASNEAKSFTAVSLHPKISAKRGISTLAINDEQRKQAETLLKLSDSRSEMTDEQWIAELAGDMSKIID